MTPNGITTIASIREQLDARRTELLASIEARRTELQPLVDEHAELVRILGKLTDAPAPTAATRKERKAAKPSTRGTREQQARELIAANPGLKAAEISRRIGSKTYTYKLLRNLAAKGAIRVGANGGHFVVER